MIQFKQNVKRKNSEALMDIAWKVFNWRFGVLKFKLFISGTNVIDLEIEEEINFKPKKIPDKLLMLSPNRQANTDRMIKFLGAVEAMIEKVNFGVLDLVVAISNSMPLQYSSKMTRRRKYKSKSKKKGKK